MYMYFECNTNVQNVSRIWPEYFPIGCKMLPHPAFSSVSTQPMDDALLQTAVLQQDLLERDVEQARKRKRMRRPRRYQTRPRLAEERRRLYGHNARLMEKLKVEDPQSFFNYLRMEPAMFGKLVQRVGQGLRSKSGRSDCI